MRYATVDLWRARVVVLFSVAIPLVWLVVIGFIAGNDAVDEESGVRVMQFITPMAAAMGVLYAAYPTVAITLALARETGVLKRVRGTPLPAWVYIVGRLGGATVFAAASVAVMLTVDVVAYDVQIVGRTLAATVVTLLVGIATFAALGTAVAAVLRASVAQAASIGSAVALTFVSGLFTFGGQTPRWMTTLGDALPLKPLADLLREQFNPLHPGSGWDLSKLAVVAAWGVAAALVSARAFRWEPQGGGPRSRAVVPDESVPDESVPDKSVPDQSVAGASVVPEVLGGARPAAAGARRLSGAVTEGRRSSAALVVDQVVAASRSVWRDPGTLFFSLAMPVGLYAFMLTTQGQFEIHGMPFAVFFAAGMAVWGAAVTSFMNLPEGVAQARDRGVLKRLRGTPVRPWHYLLGRVTVAVWFAVVITAAILAVGVLAYDVELAAGSLVWAFLVVVIGTISMGACGFALAAFIPNARAVGAVGLVVLLPLAFVSEVFVGDAPDWMDRVGNLFPLKHFQNGLAAVLADPGTPQDATHVLVMVVWGLAAAAVALRFFRWDTRGGT